MKPIGNGKLCLDRLSPGKRERTEKLIESIVEAKRQREAESEPSEVQPDDERQVPPERTWDPRREFPHEKVLYPNLGTYEHPYRPTADEITLVRELDASPHATMGRTRSNSLK